MISQTTQECTSWTRLQMSSKFFSFFFFFFFFHTSVFRRLRRYEQPLLTFSFSLQVQTVDRIEREDATDIAHWFVQDRRRNDGKMIVSDTTHTLNFSLPTEVR